MKSIREWLIVFVLVTVWGGLAAGTIAALGSMSSATATLKAPAVRKHVPAPAPILAPKAVVSADDDADAHRTN